MKLRYLAHSGFMITAGNGEKILIDPFLTGNPNAPVTKDEINADYIILTHAHGDHIGDTIEIAKRDSATIIAVNELAGYCKSKGLDAHNMHIGGAHKFSFGKVKFTIAHHGSQTPEGDYAGEPAGVLLFIEDKIIYHTGDTGLFYDMKLIGEMNSIDVMLLPIGDNFTMGIDDAVKAAEFVQPKLAIPMHYNTFPVIEADPDEFVKKAEAKGIAGKVLKYGEEIDV
jgi:L-ascorbate metabolism protein UlaG (beta-lactamase superfamily)